MKDNKNNGELISELVLRRVVCVTLFPAVLLPCGVVILFVFLCFFHFSEDLFSVEVLSWVILVFLFFWILSLITLLFCLVAAFLQSGEKVD
jgi:hypothetical protein